MLNNNNYFYLLSYYNFCQLTLEKVLWLQALNRFLDTYVYTESDPVKKKTVTTKIRIRNTGWKDHFLPMPYEYKHVSAYRCGALGPFYYLVVLHSLS